MQQDLSKQHSLLLLLMQLNNLSMNSWTLLHRGRWLRVSVGHLFILRRTPPAHILSSVIAHLPAAHSQPRQRALWSPGSNHVEKGKSQPVILHYRGRNVKQKHSSASSRGQRLIKFPLERDCYETKPLCTERRLVNHQA